MAGRPDLTLLQWASDFIYPPGALPWNGQPNQVDPGPTIVGQGFLPGQSPAAEFLNFALANSGPFLNYLDQIDVLNWTPKSSFALPLGADPFQGTFAAWDDLWRRWWVVGNTPKVLYSYDAQNWTDETGALSGGVPTLNSIAVDQNNGFVWACSYASDVTAYRGTNGTWHTLSLPNATFGLQVIWDTAGVFLIAGEDANGGTHPGIWKGTEGGGGLTGSLAVMSVANSATYTGYFQLIAGNGSGTKRLAIAKISAPVAEYRVWFNNDLAQPWVNQGAFAFSAAPVAIVCSSLNTFIVVCADGNVYATSDGSLWVNQSSMSGTCYLNCLAAKGSVILAVNKGTNGIYYLKSSIDQGVNWSIRIAYPTAQAVDPGCLISGDARLGLFNRSGGGNVFPSLSMRSQ